MRSRGRVRAVLRGAVGGLIATAVMTLYRIPLFQGIPPTSEFWARFVRTGDPEQYQLEGYVLHILYGVVAGGVFGLLFRELELDTGQRERVGGIVAGLGYGLAMSVFGTRIVFPVVLDEELDPEHRLVFHVGHAIYGLTLGTWFPSDRRLRDAYELQGTAETPPGRADEFPIEAPSS